MSTYTTFLRSALSFEDFSNADKIVQDTGLTEEEARDACREYNANRTDAEITAGTKLEYTEE
jgi:hypothetical protein